MRNRRMTVLLLSLCLASPVALASDDSSLSAEKWLAETVLKARSMGYTGLHFKKVSKGEYDYAKIVEVRAGSPAAEAGLKAGDVLMAINGVQLQGDGDRWAAMKEANVGWKPGAEHVYLVQRKEGGEWVKKSISVTLSQPPESAVAEMVGTAVLSKFKAEKKMKKKQSQ